MPGQTHAADNSEFPKPGAGIAAVQQIEASCFLLESAQAQWTSDTSRSVLFVGFELARQAKGTLTMPDCYRKKKIFHRPQEQRLQR